jgi:hypothetical protein
MWLRKPHFPLPLWGNGHKKALGRRRFFSFYLFEKVDQILSEHKDEVLHHIVREDKRTMKVFRSKNLSAGIYPSTLMKTPLTTAKRKKSDQKF